MLQFGFSDKPQANHLLSVYIKLLGVFSIFQLTAGVSKPSRTFTTKICNGPDQGTLMGTYISGGLFSFSLSFLHNIALQLQLNVQ